MTVSSTTTPRKAYAGNGATTNFPITFPYAAEADVVVVHVSAAGVETTWTQNSEYTISSAEVVAGTAPASGASLVLYRDTDITQETDMPNNQRVPGPTEEAALDKLTYIVQELNEILGRSPTLPIDSSTGIDMELPDPSAGLGIGWNATADGLANLATIGAVSVSAFMETVLDDADAAAALVTLGITSSPTELNLNDGLTTLGNSGTFANNANGNPNISDTVFAVSGLAESAWAEIGPTGEANAWAALDSVPAAADWIEVKVVMYHASTADTANSGRFAQLYARKSGASDETHENDNLIGYAGSPTDDTGNGQGFALCTAKIPMATGKKFDVYWYSNFNVSDGINLYLTGWGYNP